MAGPAPGPTIHLSWLTGHKGESLRQAARSKPVGDQPVPTSGKDGFGMELDTVDLEAPVADPHHRPVRCPRADFQVTAQRGRVNDQRVVPGGGERYG